MYNICVYIMKIKDKKTKLCAQNIADNSHTVKRPQAAGLLLTRVA